MHGKHRFHVVLLALTAAAAVAKDDPNALQTLTVYFENDMFAATDRYYTNGVRLSWLSQDLESLRGKPIFEAMRRIVPGFEVGQHTHNIGIAVGQNIYTPEDIFTPDLITDDRPYAGWLYGSLSLHRKTATELHTFELTLGVVGPEALGEEAQNRVHEVRSLRTAKGWAHQLGTEPGLLLSYDYKHRWVPWQSDRWGIDLIPRIRGQVGNVHTSGMTGATIRGGWNVPRDFHGNRIDASGYTLPSADQPRRGKFSLYAFASVEGHAVALDIFLDGNTFRDSHSVDREIWVGQAEFGVGMRWRRWQLTYGQVMRTKTFVQQDGTQQFGSMTLACSF